MANWISVLCESTYTKQLLNGTPELAMFVLYQVKKWVTVFSIGQER